MKFEKQSKLAGTEYESSIAHHYATFITDNTKIILNDLISIFKLVTPNHNEALNLKPNVYQPCYSVAKLFHLSMTSANCVSLHILSH